jgi:hypothetical protein
MSPATLVGRPKPFYKKIHVCFSYNVNRVVLGVRLLVLNQVSRLLPVNVLRYEQKQTETSDAYFFFFYYFISSSKQKQEEDYCYANKEFVFFGLF